MKFRWSKGLILALLCLTTPFAFADTVSMNLVNQPLTSWGGQYVSPYAAQITKIDGVTQTPAIDTRVICLDISVNTYIGTTYLYDRTFNEGPASYATLPAATPEMYQTAARLGHQLLYTPGLTTTARGQLAFAIWQVFNSSAINSLSTANKNAVNALIAQAQAQSWTPDFAVLTPQEGTFRYPSQRFMTVVNVPEASSAAMLGLCLFGLFGLVVTLRRREFQQ